MDAVEYEKYRIKMCKEMILKKGGCAACGMYDLVRQRCRTPASVCMKEDEDYYKENVTIVEEWAKDHPVKTRQSEFLKMFPNAKTMGGVIVICPNHIDSTYRNVDTCDNSFCDGCCKKYWLEEVTDND